MCVACICMCVCVCGSQRAVTILHSHGVWHFWRASWGLCIISVFRTQRKCYIESLLLVHKRIEKLFVKLKGPPYSCLLTTCLSSGSRIPIKILKPSISFSRRVEGEGQSVNLLSISSCASTIGCTTETLPVLFQCSTRTHIGWAGRRYGWGCALMNHTEATYLNLKNTPKSCHASIYCGCYRPLYLQKFSCLTCLQFSSLS